MRARFVIDRRGRRYPNTLAERTVLKETTRLARMFGATIATKWLWHHGGLDWEFHYGDFVWRGLASNAFDARVKGWEAWIVATVLERRERQIEIPIEVMKEAA